MFPALDKHEPNGRKPCGTDPVSSKMGSYCKILARESLETGPSSFELLEHINVDRCGSDEEAALLQNVRLSSGILRKTLACPSSKKDGDIWMQ